ncbi:HAD family hydrolase [Listeria costaricensis]|uniref:HAD family hydrolase n=1 Tax=Listeria costaricensis TaxID=2026604 RepID=UPI000C0736CC|nr:HAD family hydrolase [Listeria costaricensis]
MTTKYLICSDIDGTLIRADHTIPNENLEMILALQKAGHHFSVSTGRLYQGAFEVAQMISPETDVIASNGSYATAQGKAFHQFYMEKDAARATYEILNHYDLPLFFFSTNELFFTKNPPAFFHKLAESKRFSTGHERFSLVPIHEVQAFEEHAPSFLNAIVISEDAPEKLAEVRNVLEQENGLRILSSHHNNLEVLPAGSDKAKAVELLAKHYEIPRENIIAFGDGENDIGMLEYAGIGVAMANAPDNVKQAANHITADNEAGGVAQFLRQIF